MAAHDAAQSSAFRSSSPPPASVPAANINVLQEYLRQRSAIVLLKYEELCDQNRDHVIAAFDAETDAIDKMIREREDRLARECKERIDLEQKLRLINVAYPGSAAGQLLSIHELLARGKISRAERSVVSMMFQRFAARTQLALNTQSPREMAAIYHAAKALPSTATVASLKSSGYMVGEPLFEGSEIQHCACTAKDGPFTLKTISQSEFNTISDFVTKLGINQMPPSLLPFELVASNGKYFFISPHLPCTIQVSCAMVPRCAQRLWQQMREALEFIHSFGFAHMDVKPSNILHDQSGSFRLGDFGSMAPYGNTTSSTPAFLPLDLRRKWQYAARAETDWWMLAVTLLDRTGLVSAGLDAALTCADVIQRLENAAAEHPCFTEVAALLTSLSK
jgi:hypothetical protein